MLEGITQKYTVPIRESDLSLSILGGSSSHKKYGRIRYYFMKETKWPTNRITVNGGVDQEWIDKERINLR